MAWDPQVFLAEVGDRGWIVQLISILRQREKNFVEDGDMTVAKGLRSGLDKLDSAREGFEESDPVCRDDDIVG